MQEINWYWVPNVTPTISFSQYPYEMIIIIEFYSQGKYDSK